MKSALVASQDDQLCFCDGLSVGSPPGQDEVVVVDRTSPFRDAIEVCSRTNNDAAAYHGWGRQHRFVERVLVKQLELGTCFDHEGIAILAEREDLSVVGPWRRREPLE